MQKRINKSKTQRSVFKTNNNLKIELSDDFNKIGLSSYINQNINWNYQKKVIHRIIKSYQKMKEAQRTVSEPYQPGHKWGPEIEDRRAEYVSALKTKNTDELTKLFQNFFRNSGSYALLKYLPYQYLMKKSKNQRELISDFYHQLSMDIETWKEYVVGYLIKDLELPQIGNPYGCIVENVLITPASCPLHYYSFRVRELLDGISKPIVAEIGGGFGGFAYYLLKPENQITYIDFDLPEIVVMAAYFLMMSFPNKKILLYGETDNLVLSPEIVHEYSAILMPNYQLPSLVDNSVDLFINTHSLSEMDYPTIKEYSDQIARTCKLYFFHENSELEQDIGYGNKEVTASNFPIPKNIFKRVYKLNALWREPRYREYLYLHK